MEARSGARMRVVEFGVAVEQMRFFVGERE
jgi:hypothetical protein